MPFLFLLVVPVLVEKQHKLKGKDAVVKVYDSKSAYDETAVIVSGLTEKIDKELLQLYFENERYGGGSIKNIDIQNSKAVIKFNTEKGEFDCIFPSTRWNVSFLR